MPHHLYRGPSLLRSIVNGHTPKERNVTSECIGAREIVSSNERINARKRIPCRERIPTSRRLPSGACIPGKFRTGRYVAFSERISPSRGPPIGNGDHGPPFRQRRTRSDYRSADGDYYDGHNDRYYDLYNNGNAIGDA